MALNKRPVTTDSKAGAVKGEGLAMDVPAAVMIEGKNGDEPTSRMLVRGRWSLRNGAPIPDAAGVKTVKGEGRGTKA